MWVQIAPTRKTTKKLKHQLAAMISVSVLLIGGCATPPPAPLSNEQIETHSLKQIRQAIRADNLSQTCAKISKDKQSETQNLYRQWLTEHWELVVGADAQYRSTLSGNTLAFEGQTLSMQALRFYADEVEAANASFSYLSRVRTDPSRICLRKMQQTLDALVTSDRLKERLLQLADQHPQPPSPGDRVPSLAGDFTIDAESGRSHYQVEQTAKAMSCATPKIITFKNQWPSEIYGAFCSGDHQLINCEWGKCKKL